MCDVLAPARFGEEHFCMTVALEHTGADDREMASSLLMATYDSREMIFHLATVPGVVR